MFADDDYLKKDYKDEAEFQQALKRHFASSNIDFTEGSEMAGGETDLFVLGRLIVENKIDRTGGDPFSVQPTAPYQANRYAMAKCSRVVASVVAYKPKSEAEVLPQPHSIQVRLVKNLKFAVAEVRVVVPFGLSNPSNVKVPR